MLNTALFIIIETAIYPNANERRTAFFEECIMMWENSAKYLLYTA